jgi:hypothetical protein
MMVEMFIIRGYIAITKDIRLFLIKGVCKILFNIKETINESILVELT